MGEIWAYVVLCYTLFKTFIMYPNVTLIGSVNLNFQGKKILFDEEYAFGHEEHGNDFPKQWN